MRLGVNLPNFGPGTTPDVLRRWAQTVEGLGFDLLMVSDHLAITDDVAQVYPAPFYEPFSLLAWLAGVTSRIRLGTTVLLLPYRHPLQVARMAGDIDALAGGDRLVLGVGTGWAREEFAALGLPFAKRGAMTDDHLAALRVLLANDIASYEGSFVSFRNVRTAPRPAHLPVWVGGNSDIALRRAVRLGDGWHPLRFGSMSWLRGALDRMTNFATELGTAVPALAPRIPLQLTDSPVTDADRPVGTGTLAQIRADLDELSELGAETVILDTTNTDDPNNTRRPNTAWRLLASVAEAHLNGG
ncbi:MAG TPA: TIGR03619 family F420-dependent LLM class oxidoreductase [Pseudonocardiaceae bacterium]|jgi:probable F420-dependent oxidoreductase|nr:TIGR03619 family F420-dependent LLM class oxidoreductase [Pseudonocardiaceae bacterium]